MPIYFIPLLGQENEGTPNVTRRGLASGHGGKFEGTMIERSR
jgi:hypothetical protein